MTRNTRRSVSRRPVSGVNAPAPVEFTPDYTHIKRDLKRIGTLAGSFFVLLVILSFFIK